VKETVLIVEDESTLADVLADNLRLEGYRVWIAADGTRGLESWRRLEPDLVVLDVMLPRLSGFELCQRMREGGDRTPVLFLSAKSQAEDRVKGLEVGGDDYLAKPFHLPEFLLRVRAMLRRRRWAQAPDEAGLRFGGHHIDWRSGTVTLKGGRKEVLAERELAILKLLAERAPQVVSRDDILDEVWGEEAFPSSRTIHSYIVKLRKRFEPDPDRPIYLHAVLGTGYRFTPEGENEEVSS
jgi:two-component system, OmpR family, alkaline phosphatase synthesis response regulator PhoP